MSAFQLKQDGSENTKLTQEISRWWCKCNSGVELQLCNQAAGEKGREWLKLLATRFESKVTGWTGGYEITPTGDQWTATPGPAAGSEYSPALEIKLEKTGSALRKHSFTEKPGTFTKPSCPCGQ